jgi:2,4-dichlorophenol 6-monooxygenase
MSVTEVDVIIVGGGACGLTSSIILSDLGINHLVVERRPTASNLPKAHYYNQRTMEIFRQHGVADDLYEIGMPMANCKVRYVTSLGGDGPLDKRELFIFDGFGGGPFRQVSDVISPGRTLHLPQCWLEPALQRLAQGRWPNGVKFNTEVMRFTEDADGINVVTKDHDTQSERVIRAKYMIAADGGRTIGDKIGIVREAVGEYNRAVLVTAHVSADLSKYVPGDAMITHLIHPESRFRWGVLVPVGPSWGPGSEQWAFSFAYHADDPNRLNESNILPAIKESMGLPDIDITVHSVNEWLTETSVANKFREGRIFVAGDAAHRVIPTSGLGLNSAVHDAHNICWKLALVLDGTAGAELLDSYEAERRAATLRNAEWSWFTFHNHIMTEIGMGLMPGASAEANVKAITAYLADSPLGRTLRARAKEVVGTQRTEYGAVEIELGGTYQHGAVISDDVAIPQDDPMGDTYTPTTHPGRRLPHAWIESGAIRISTHDLTGRTESFALITGSQGEAWLDAADSVAASLGVKIKAIDIGVGCKFSDPSGQWEEVKGITEQGVVLVRPDNIVAFRAQQVTSNTTELLTEVLSKILSNHNLTSVNTGTEKANICTEKETISA